MTGVPLQGVGKSRRLGARSKYIDIMNQGGAGGPTAAPPPPPGPPPMSVVPGASLRPFTGTFFVPSPVEGTGCCIFHFSMCMFHYNVCTCQ